MKRDLDIENRIVNDYVLGINNKELCEKYCKSRAYIQIVLIRHGIVLRRGCEVTKKYNLNENYFEHIDSSDKAYILGLLFSDGTISRTIAAINLMESDGHILYDIAKKIYVDNKYQIQYLKAVEKKWKNGVTYKTKPQLKLTLTRKKIVEDLKKFGLCEKKSFKIRFPQINQRYYRDFIRGYFDGDGCFYSSEKYPKNNRVQIVSNTKFIYDLKEIIENSLNIKTIITDTKVNNISRLYIYGNAKTKIFLDWIYNGAELKLNRKYLHYINKY
jgi:hypothetical protein